MPNVTVYVVTSWQNLPTKTTAVNASNLNHMENGIKAVTDFVNTLNKDSGLYLCQTPFTTALKTKLDGIEAQANKYVLPTASASTLGGVKVDGTTITISNGIITAVQQAPSIALDGLTDVDLSNLANGQVLKYDSANSKWVNANDNVVTELSALSDVGIQNPADGQLFCYDATEGKWVNRTITITANLADLGDADISNPTDGQVLKYNYLTSKWENANDSGGGGSSTLAGLTDVYIDDHPIAGAKLTLGFRNNVLKWQINRCLPPDLEYILFNLYLAKQRIFRGAVNQDVNVSLGEGITATFNAYGSIYISGDSREGNPVYIDTHDSDIPLPTITSIKCGGYLRGIHSYYFQTWESDSNIECKLELTGNYRDTAYDYGEGHYTDMDYTIAQYDSYNISGKIYTPSGSSEGDDLQVAFTRYSTERLVITIPPGLYSNVQLQPCIIYKK